MPTWKSAPRVLIQVNRSTNCILSELSRSNQNHNGRETRNPLRTTKLAHQRIRVLFSLFINRRTNIPASGQKATMLRICCRKKSIECSLISPQGVADQDQNSKNHHERVILRVSGLDQAEQRTECSQKAAHKTDQPIDDPSIPPARSLGAL